MKAPRTRSRLVAAGSILLLATLAAQCSSKPDTPAGAPGGSPADLTPFVTIKELMVDVVDPQADFIFDAVAVDVTQAGAVETRPTTDEEWGKVQRGAVILAESTNLLKMRRAVAPGDAGDQAPAAGAAPELSPAEVQARIDKDPARWNRHVDLLRDEALKVMAIVKAKDADKLFQAGSDVDKACESCHLEYWYPGDKAAVEKDRKSGVFTDRPPAPR